MFDSFNVLLSFLAETWYRTNMKLSQKASFGSETWKIQWKQLFLMNFYETCRFWPPDSVFWWSWHALESSGRKMKPNEYEITSKSQFCIRNMRNLMKSRHLGYPADRVSPRIFPPLFLSIYFLHLKTFFWLYQTFYQKLPKLPYSSGGDAFS